MKPLELATEQRKEAIASLQQYYERNMPEPVGELAAGLLLDFFLAEIGPAIFNGAVRKAAERMQWVASELDSELYQAPFTYWHTSPKRSR